MALRRNPDGTLDDVVVEDVAMFRAEFMSDDELWLCCYFRNGERVVFWATLEGPANRKQGIVMHETEVPEKWIDWDERR